jgi:phosphatidylglycerol:prolipoprotein diacylglycerol transferase
MSNSFSLFGLNITYYSICILLGVIVAYLIIKKLSKNHKINPRYLEDIIFYGLLSGIVGARLYYVLFNLDYYLKDINEIVMVWHGGLAIHGGILAGALFVYLYSRKNKLNFIELTDIILPGVIIAQAIGRWGNFFNQEAYGMEVSKELLQKLLIPNFIIEGMNISGNYYLPTFYIESIFCIIGFILIMIISRKTNKIGYPTAFYLIWYGILRFIIELFRTDSLMLFNIKIACIISVSFILLGLLLGYYTKSKGKEV